MDDRACTRFDQPEAVSLDEVSPDDLLEQFDLKACLLRHINNRERGVLSIQCQSRRRHEPVDQRTLEAAPKEAILRVDPGDLVEGRPVLLMGRRPYIPQLGK